MASDTPKKLVTHNGSFHADDIFACATLILYLEKNGESYEITRTRDEAKFKEADYLFDVGGISDMENNKFDHHQPGGAGKHTNGIEYASFGLVWKKFGLELSGSQDTADIINTKLVSPIDAGDNAINLFESTNEVKPYLIHNVFVSFKPTWKNFNDENLYAGFLQCVKIAKKVLVNEITFAKDLLEAKVEITKGYDSSENKKMIILDKNYPWHETLMNYSEPVFVVYPRPVDGKWGVEAVPSERASFKRRKDFPVSWGGLRAEELIKLTGVEDAVFCHRGLYMCVAKSKEGAVKLAQIALES